MKRIILSLILLGVTPVELRSQGAATFHVFPQIADGVLSDGTGYVSLVLATNVSTQPARCTLRPYGGGLANRFFGSSTFTLPGSGSFNILPTVAALNVFLPLTTGYATLSCDQPVVMGAMSVPARSNSARFLDELVTLPANFSGAVSITSSSSSFSVVGLFFIGSVFLSQPA